MMAALVPVCVQLKIDLKTVRWFVLDWILLCDIRHGCWDCLWCRQVVVFVQGQLALVLFRQNWVAIVHIEGDIVCVVAQLALLIFHVSI